MGSDLVSLAVFIVVWLGLVIIGGPLGFFLGWIPALIIARVWPLLLVGSALVLTLVIWTAVIGIIWIIAY